MIKTLFLPQNKKQPLLLAGRVQLSLQYTKVCRLLLENRIEPLLLTYTPKQKKITPTDLLNAYMKVESYRIVSTFFCFLNACGILNENRYTSDSVLCSAAQLFYVLTHLRFSSAFNTTALMYITAYSMQNDTTMLVYCFVLNKRKHVFILCPVSTKQVPDSAKALYYNAAWYEREVSEMFGVKFSSKVDTRNLILPYGYVEHPLKKNVTGNYTFSIRFSGCEHMLKWALL